MNKNEKTTDIIGKARLPDFEAYFKWYKENSKTVFSFEVPENIWKNHIYALQGKLSFNVSAAFDRSGPPSRFCSEEDFMKELKEIVDFYNRYGLHLNLYYQVKEIEMSFVGPNPNKIYLIPDQFLFIDLFKDYSSLTPSQILSLDSKENQSDGHGVVLMNGLKDVSQDNLENYQKQALDAKSKLESQIQDIEEAKSGKLAEMREEIERKQAELELEKRRMMASLEEQKEVLERTLKDLERSVFLLDGQIYSIRCFLGETVDFVKIREGKDAEVETPVVLNQKLRFLDEELGKIASIYDVDFSDAKLFEELIFVRDDVLDAFCPSPKCVTLVKVSKTDRYYSKGQSEYGEILMAFDKYHGQKIGILIRNGENLYIGWTDDERVRINDDFFYAPGEKELVEEDNSSTSIPFYDPKRAAEEEEKKKMKEAKEMFSRYFVFSILQGVTEHQHFITLPEKVDYSRPSKYVIYSTADAWLSDNRFGSFADLVKKCNSYVAKGHQILMLEYLSDGSFKRDAYFSEYSRDHNYSRRTGDCYAHNGEIYKVNLVEDDSENSPHPDQAIYISLKKEFTMDLVRDPIRGGWKHRERDAYANFRVYTDEFVNVSYMNSVWLRYVITNRNLGGYKERGDYAHMIVYLKKALDHVKEREKTERELILPHFPWIDEIKEWQVRLSEWKIENKIVNFTDWQAKRFAKTLSR